MDPLAKPLGHTSPACFNCPAGADCSAGGNKVTFPSGVWSLHNGMIILVSCPPGYQLINSTDGTAYGTFSHDNQECRPCKQNQYLVDQLENCQNCPSGAVCNGSGLNGFEGSFWRREGDKLRVYKCDPGYILVRNDEQNGALAFFDACVQCLPSTYSLVGARIIGNTSDPCVWTGLSGQPYTCSPIQENQFAGFEDDAVSGTWTSSPDQAQQLCLKCPIGALCPGGSNVIPQVGYWVDSASNTSVSRRTMGVSATTEEVLIFRCQPGACLGNGTCGLGRSGPVCAICMDGWAKASNDCSKCSTDTIAKEAEKILVTVACSILALLLYFFFSLRPLFMGIDGSQDDGAEFLVDQASDYNDGNVEIKQPILFNVKKNFEKIKSLIMTIVKVLSKKEVLLFLQGYLKVTISFLQVLSTFADNLKVAWPASLFEMFQLSALVRCDLISLPGLNCLFVGFGYQSQLMMYTLAPLIVVFLLIIAPCLSLWVPRFKTKVNAVWNQFWYSLMLFLFLIYPTASVATLRTFNCQEVGHYGYLLIADYSTACPFMAGSSVLGRENFVFWWAFIFGVLYPVGIPVFFLLSMLVYKVPAIAESKIRVAKVQALINEYRIRAMPLEVEILTRQLRIDSLMPVTLGFDGNVLEYRICHLFEMLADEKGVVVAEDLLKFLKNPCLGLPDPDESIIQEMFESGDTSGDGKLDRSEFITMMKQAVYVHELFTGHEELDDMHFDQLFRIYEFHANGRIYIENCKDLDADDSGVTGLLQSVSSRIRDSVSTFYSKRSKDCIVEMLLSSHDVSNFDIDSYDADEIEYPGMQKYTLLAKKVNTDMLSSLQTLMTADIKRKILAIADAKIASGATVIHSIAWNSPEQKKANLTQMQRDEELAVQRLGFLMRNYDVRHWYYEIIEMVRRLLMTCIIAFIYNGSYAQIASALMISILAAFYVECTRPFIDKKLGDTQSFALLAQSLTLLYGLLLLFQEIYSDLLQLDLPFPNELLTTLFAFLVVCMNVSTLFFPYIPSILAALLTCASTCWYFLRKKKAAGSNVKTKTRDSKGNQLESEAEHRRESRLWNQSCLLLDAEWKPVIQEENQSSPPQKAQRRRTSQRTKQKTSRKATGEDIDILPQTPSDFSQVTGLCIRTSFCGFE